ncbi:MAG: LytR/AlgR family response regulator transcription factor [Flavobacteriaceae bacterium]
MKRTEVSYTFFRNTKVLLIAAITVGLLQIIGFVIYKGQFELLSRTFTDASLFLRRFVVDRILVDAVSVLILFSLTSWLGKFIAPRYPDSRRDWVKFNFRYLFLVLISLGLFVPLAIVLRHYWRNGLSLEAARLVSNFRHFGRVYLQSAIPLILVGHVAFNINLLFKRSNARSQSGKKEMDRRQPDHLEVINENGNTLIQLTEIYWIERKLRTCWVRTKEKSYRVRKTLKELEEIMLPSGFIRINRSAIVNRNYIHNYSYWEYDKFILRMEDEENTEFIVSRERMKHIKDKLSTGSTEQKQT